MEHLERFGLEREPFRNEPQPDFWFESRGVSEAKARLLRCLRQGKELSVLCGELGSGTTTLARHVLDELDPDRFEVGLLVVGRGVEPAWLRSAVARQLGVAEPAGTRAEALRELYLHLVELRKEGRRAVVAIDEAQALGVEALAELVAMLNFEHDDERLLSALLVGSLELERMLGREPALLGRCELRVRIEPLAGEEARAYLAHRLVVAGGDPALFAPELADVIAARAGGLPRRMNALADNALFEAHLARREWPEPADVERAARDLPWAQSGADTLSGVSPAALGLAPHAPAAPELGDFDLDAELGPELSGGEGALHAGVSRAHVSRPARAFDREPHEEELQAELATTGPDHTAPGAWSRPRRASLDDEVLGTAPPRLPDESEIDGLFVDLVDEEKD
ncbi:MAG: AAA family ATPase [Deltaproteobacteria bacterium]|nr:AAA family ATPase [Deltaproteobacteria bacterium]